MTNIDKRGEITPQTPETPEPIPSGQDGEQMPWHMLFVPTRVPKRKRVVVISEDPSRRRRALNNAAQRRYYRKNRASILAKRRAKYVIGSRRDYNARYWATQGKRQHLRRRLLRAAAGASTGGVQRVDEQQARTGEHDNA